MHQNKISLQSSSLHSPLLLHELRPSERTKSGRNHPSPTAGKKAQVRLDPVISSLSKGSPFVIAGRVVGFFFKSPIFLFFLVHSRPSLGIFNEILIVSARVIMTSINPSSILRDHLYSTDDILKRGRPPPLLKGADEDIIIDEEPAPKTTPVVDPASISRCCIERGLFSAIPLFFQYPYGTSKGWSEWVDRELRNPSTCDILSRAGVLDAIFISKTCDIHIEAKMLQHVVRRWSTETHTFICSWGEFAPTLEDVANIFHLPLCGNQYPFHIVLTLKDKLKLEILRKGAPTSPSTSLQFSNWIQFFGNVNRNEPCRLAAFVSYGLGDSSFVIFLKTVYTSGGGMNHGCRNQIPNTRLEEPDTSGMPLEFVSDHERHVDIEPVVPTFEDRTGCSQEVVIGLPATITDTVQTVGKSISQGAENTHPIPSLGTSSVATDTALYLPAA
ncbi:unnamed protein product [Prunus armeniaca]